jgi:hypothetical protein
MRVVRWSSRNSSSSARVVGGSFHRVQHPELPVQQRLVAQRQVEEDLVDGLAQVRLADGRVHGRALHGGERLGHPRHLGDLADGQRRRLRGHVDRVALAQPLDDVRQPLAGHGLGPVLQAGEVPADGPAEADHKEHRHQHREQAEAARQARFQEEPVADLAGLAAQWAGVAGSDRGHLGLEGPRHLPPVAQRARGYDLPAAGRRELVLQAGQRGVQR